MTFHTINYTLWQSAAVIVFLLTAITGCASKVDEQANQVETVHEFTLDDDISHYIHRMQSVVMDNPKADELVFTNFQSPVHIVVSDYEGNMLARVGREGRGPGEIIGVRNFGFDPVGNILVYDPSSKYFHIYNRIDGSVQSYLSESERRISISSRNLQYCVEKWYFGVQEPGAQTNPDVPVIGVFNAEFELEEIFGGYDPFFNGQKDVMQEPIISVDCTNQQIYISHGKVPFIQKYNISDRTQLLRSEEIPASYMLSDKFIQFVSGPHEMARFMSEEQSLSLHLGYSDDHVYLAFRNGMNIVSNVPTLQNNHYFVAVFDKTSLKYLGEVKVDGVIYGFTKHGYAIVMIDPTTYLMNLIKIKMVDYE